MILQICIIFVVLLISRVHKVVNVSWWVIVNCHHQDEDEYDDHSTLILRVVTVGRGFAETILWHHFMHHNKSYLVICHILSSYLVISICYTLSPVFVYSPYLVIRINRICHQYFSQWYFTDIPDSVFHSGISQTVGKSGDLSAFAEVVFFKPVILYYNIMEESKRCTMLY